MDIREKNCNTYTFQKVNGECQPKAALAPDTTGINSPLLFGFQFSEYLTEEAYLSNESLPIPTRRRYAYSVL